MTYPDGLAPDPASWATYAIPPSLRELNPELSPLGSSHISPTKVLSYAWLVGTIKRKNRAVT